MIGPKIVVLFLPLLFLVGAHSDTDGYRRPQSGKPWVAPTFMNSMEDTEDETELKSDDSRGPQPGIPWVAPTILTNSDEDISKEKESDLERYVSQLYTDSYTEAPTTQLLGNGLRGYRCPQSDGYFKYTDRCDEYIKCRNYIPVTYTCPVGLYFNPYLQWTESPCDHPSRVQCNTEPIYRQLRFPVTSSSTTTTTTTTTTPPPPPITPKTIPPSYPVAQPQGFMCPRAHGYFKYTDECGQYVECKNYVPLMFTCPVGLHFNPRVEWTAYPCDYPSRVQCVKKEKPTTTSTTTTTTTTTTPAPTPAFKLVPTPRPANHGFMCPQPHGYFRHTDQCGEYIECKNYVPLTFTCPVGLHFNPLVPWTEYPCDYPSRVQCNREPVIPEIPPTPKFRPPPTTTTTTTTTTTPPPPPPTTEKAVIVAQPNYMCPQPFGYFKRSNECGEYVECKNYVPLMFTCPTGLHFNPLVQWTEYPCAHPSKVQCDYEPSPKSPLTPPPTTTTEPSTTTPTTTTPTTTTPTTTTKVVTTPRPGRQIEGFMCPQPHGYFEHAGQCGEYVECKNHVPLSYNCPAGLHFNPRVQWTDYPCDHPSSAQCSSRRK